MADCRRRETTEADLILLNGNVYTLTWDEPDREGNPAPNAPHTLAGWKADAEAVAARAGKILFVGKNAEAEHHRGSRTRVVDVARATVVPGLIDSHVHIFELGMALERVNLFGVNSESEAVARVAARAAQVPKGEWVIGKGWDEGAWANHYPDMKSLSERVPDHPVCLIGLHGYAVWGNRLAFEKAGITAATKSPQGGEIRKGADGKPTGIPTNRASSLLEAVIPAPTEDQLRARVLAALKDMASSGYVAIHEAGANSAHMKAFEDLNAGGKLFLRIYAMLSDKDKPLLRAWLRKGPDSSTESMLITRSVKAFYDGALGSRGARLLEDYSDRNGYRGFTGSEYGFDKDAMSEMMKAGFQIAVHAIGDAGNRETLDFFETVLKSNPSLRANRHRIEHAQALNPADIARFASLGILASMEPPHAVDDMAWAEDRLGPERVKHAYAWRSLRRAGAVLLLNSDLPGTDHNIFYGLHSAITRRGKDLQPPGGWHPEQRMNPEETLRGYTIWGAYSAFLENQTGTIAPGKWADITVMDLDPLAIGEKAPDRLLQGSILMTVVGGKVVYEKGR
jgi:hypothetical protein